MHIPRGNGSSRSSCVLRVRLFISLLPLVIFAGACSRPQPSGTLTPDRSAAVTKDVRAFLAAMADDITKRGPAAWRTHFADTSNFYMAAEGQMIFADSPAATKGIKDLTGVLSRLDLKWGEPMRIEPLSATVAAVAMPYHEVLVHTSGKTVVEDGYFTGLVELGPSGWKVRNAHWSVKPPPDRPVAAETTP